MRRQESLLTAAVLTVLLLVGLCATVVTLFESRYQESAAIGILTLIVVELGR